MIFSSLVPCNVTTPRPIVEYLSQRFTYHSPQTWAGLITAGTVRINGTVAALDATVQGNQTITYDAGEFDEPAADLDYSIIYEDEWLLAVNKPGNLLIHRAGRSFKNNLIYQLRCVHTPPYPEARSIHRLDRMTSGIVLIAKTPEMQAEIDHQFKLRTVRKEYQAFVEGIPLETPQRITLPIVPDTGSTVRSKFRPHAEGKEAVSLITSSEPLGDDCALVVLEPLTGRTHQLRVHCSAIGHPIVGDHLYGSTVPFNASPRQQSENTSGGCAPQRHALHCGKITFYHTRKKSSCCIEAPLPDDMRKLRDLLKDKKKGA